MLPEQPSTGLGTFKLGLQAAQPDRIVRCFNTECKFLIALLCSGGPEMTRQAARAHAYEFVGQNLEISQKRCKESNRKFWISEELSGSNVPAEQIPTAKGSRAAKSENDVRAWRRI